MIEVRAKIVCKDCSAELEYWATQEVSTYSGYGYGGDTTSDLYVEISYPPDWGRTGYAPYFSYACPTCKDSPFTPPKFNDGPGPACSGIWIGGSGGHRKHKPCKELASWWHPDDMYSYCDSHVSASDKKAYEQLWRETNVSEDV